MSQLTFVVGTGRSGSTAVSRLLHTHPEVLSISEYWSSVGPRTLSAGSLTGAEFWSLLTAPHLPFERMLEAGLDVPELLYHRKPGRRFSHETAGIPALCQMVLPALTDDPDALYDELEPVVSGWPRRPTVEHHEALFAWLRERCGGDVIVERSGQSLGFVPALHADFPRAKFVHLHRNGPDCALSMSRHPGFRGTLLLQRALDMAGVASVVELERRHVEALPPQLARLFGQSLDASTIWDQDIDAADFGAMWSELIVEGEAVLKRIPAPVLHMSYEELLERPHEMLTELTEFIGVTAPASWLDSSSASLHKSSKGSALRLPPEDLDMLRKSCQPGTEVLADLGS